MFEDIKVYNLWYNEFYNFSSNLFEFSNAPIILFIILKRITIFFIQ